MFNNIYHNKKVLITGNTGFKGSWLTIWLLKLGAKVIGVSKDVPTKPSMFAELQIKEKIKYYQKDICNLKSLYTIVSTEKPDFIFHLAAQPIVLRSYAAPLETIKSNVLGTVNLLEALKNSNHSCVAIIITSDKSYDNIEQIWGYKENDQIGGKDIYSGSKGAAELLIKSYFHSFFNKRNCNIRIAIGRAGNVIGGGDWGEDRIVVNCVEAWSKKKSVEIRNPNSTRPWQHVMEPISGYLDLGAQLFSKKSLHGEAFNFGPKAEQNNSVKQLLKDLSTYWNFKKSNQIFSIKKDKNLHEASLLKLNCDKALSILKWQANLAYEDTIKFTSLWYLDFYKNLNHNMYKLTLSQIDEYERIAKKKELQWTV